MSAQDGSYHFVGAPAAHRNPQLPVRKWEEHRAEVTEIYLRSKKLDDVVGHMRKKYGIVQTKRQYSYHLDEWGVKKQDARIVTTTRPLPRPEDSVSPRGQLKRHRLTGSTRSSDSANSSLSKPPRKRNNPAQALEGAQRPLGYCVDPTAGFLALSPNGAWLIKSPNTGEVGSPMTLVGEPSPRLDSASRKSGSIEPRSNQWADSPMTLVEEPCNRLDSAVGLSPSSRLSNQGGTAKGRAEPKLESELRTGFTWSPSFPRISVISMLDMTEYSIRHSQSGANLEPGVRVIRHGRPVDTFTSQDVADIKRAADFFSAIGCGKEAFELYTTLLKRHTSDPTYRDTSFWYLVIQSVYTAGVPEHLEVVQNIIRQELERFQDTSVGSDHTGGFLFNMLLAYTHSKIADKGGVLEHLSRAHAYASSDDSWFLHMLNNLPMDDRSLDLVLYHSALRLRLGETVDLVSPTVFEFTPFSPSTPSPRFESDILKRGPGPFELGWEGRVACPCLGSCVLWCVQKLEHLASLPPTPGVETYCPDKMAIGWTEANALFFSLWRQWAAEDVHSSSDDKPIWMSESQRRMGISPTLLLMLVCRAIHDGYPSGPAPATQELELPQRLQRHAERLFECTDLQLARRFLNQYILHHTITTWPGWRSNVHRLERVRAIVCLEEVLGVAFPNLGVAPDDLVESTGFPGLPCCNKDLPAIPEAQPLPTLAGPARWSRPSYKGFQEASDRAALQVGNLTRGTISSLSIPSRSLMRSGSQTSSQRLSDLSGSLSAMMLLSESVLGNRESSPSTG